MNGVDKSVELALAEAVAERTAERFRAGLREELDARDAALRQAWQEGLGQLRDDLTAKHLLDELKVAAPAARDAGAAVHVLVADDHDEVRRAFAKMFTKYGMQIFDASSGAHAADVLDTYPEIEVVVADVAMPKNGYTLLEHVRKKFPHIEVIMTSGYEQGANKARELGAFAFLPKPFNAMQAVLLVERAAEFRRLKLAAARG